MSLRSARALFAVAGCLLVLTSAARAADPTAPAKAARPAAAKARPDTTPPESPPGKLLVPPRIAPGTVPPNPADTALAGARRRAHEEYVRGLALERDGAYAAAIVSYTNAARTDPTLRGAALRVGVLFVWKKQYEPAARAFREELHRDPQSVPAKTQYALALAELGDTTRPVLMLEELTRRVPNDAAVWSALGFAYARVGRTDAAERALRGAIALDPKRASAWRDLGVLLADRGDERGAREAYRKALAVDPEEVATLINLGNLESRAGSHEAALQHYRRAEKVDSTYLDAYRGQIRELVVLHREDEAGAVWRRWLEVFPDDDEVREGAARHFVRQGRADIALEIARDGVRRATRAGEPRWLLGEMEVASRDTLAALGAYREAWARFKAPADRGRADASIAALRAAAPDSLRARFAADSVERARPDSARTSSR